MLQKVAETGSLPKIRNKELVVGNMVAATKLKDACSLEGKL